VNDVPIMASRVLRGSHNYDLVIEMAVQAVVIIDFEPDGPPQPPV